ncbi:MAG: hypothetical protein Q7S40_19205 [Opitutaceae bacterium]|nr:hypothetical protein [Opitutaceae bacterium]
MTEVLTGMAVENRIGSAGGTGETTAEQRGEARHQQHFRMTAEKRGCVVFPSLRLFHAMFFEIGNSLREPFMRRFSPALRIRCNRTDSGIFLFGASGIFGLDARDFTRESERASTAVP